MLSLDRLRPPLEYLHGWRSGVIGGGLAATVVFLVNLVITIVCTRYQNNGALHYGECDKAEKINTILHWLINVLSSVLLSASNYCMQCLSAPTRKEIDVAHARGKWLDIGVLSTRNLRCISKKRFLLWVVLLLSSLPLHLFYNSVVYLSLPEFPYSVRRITQFNLDKYLDGNSSVANSIMDLQGFERLEILDCVNTYAKTIQSTRGDLILVTPNENVPGLPSNLESNTTFRTITEGTRSLRWMCRDFKSKDASCSTINKLRASAAKGFIGKYPVQYCLSRKMTPSCKINWNKPIAIIVTVLNLVKTIVVFYTAFRIKEKPLMSIGDAVTSFLETTDRTTVNMCLASSNDCKETRKNFVSGPRRWENKRYYWKDAPSKTRWASFIILLTTTILCASCLLYISIDDLGSSKEEDLSIFRSLDFGAIDARTLRSYPIFSGDIAYTLLANLPQVVISFVYFSYNSIFTSMLLNYEWTTYAYRKKGLRVSTKAEGDQRSSYFLSLPFRFALPLMAMSSVWHWLASQSIFFVALRRHTAWESGEENTDPSPFFDSYGFGFSPMAILIAISFGATILITTIAIGFIPYKVGTNLVGSCSAAISAACHPLSSQKSQGDKLIHKKIKWGVVSDRSDGVGHCSFSDEAVELPQKGKVYAGSHMGGSTLRDLSATSSSHVSITSVGGNQNSLRKRRE